MKYAIIAVVLAALCGVVYSQIVGIEVPGPIANCPTCGSIARLYKIDGKRQVRCTTRNCWRGPAYKTADQAVAVWNATISDLPVDYQ